MKYRPWAGGWRSGLRLTPVVVTWLLLMITGLSATSRVWSAGPVVAQPQASMADTLDFKGCLDMALKQSPHLLNSSLDIRMGNLDISDARWSYVPAVGIHTEYLLTSPSVSAGSSGPSGGMQNVIFVVGPYNPILSYFSLKAAKILKQVAVYTHMHNISKGLHALGLRFLTVDFFEGLADIQTQLTAISEEKINYLQKKNAIGAAAEVEVQIAQQEQSLSMAETEKMQVERAAHLEAMRSLMGMSTNQRPTFNFKHAEKQVLGNFKPEATRLETAKSNNYQLKALELQKELQKLNIYSTYAKFAPNLSVGMRSTDPMGYNNKQNEYYAYLGIDIRFWDGLRDYNNVSRQELQAEKIAMSRELKTDEFQAEWLGAMDKLRLAHTALKTARAAEELARLKVKQSEIQYSHNNVPLSAVLDSRQALLQSRKQTLAADHNRRLAVLQLRYLSGDLIDSHIKVLPGQE